MLLYKYRSLSGESFKYTRDIFVNRRLYLPLASSLNDPNEGVVTVDINNYYRAWGNQLFERNRRNNIRLCAFSAAYRSSVLWAHYASEHKGICIEINTDELQIGDGILRKVLYSNKVPIIPHNSTFDEREAFLNKTPEWAYEQEWRYICNAKSSSLDLGVDAITRVLVGARFHEGDINWLQLWLSNYTQTRQIPIIKMSFASTDYSLYEESEMQGKVGRVG
jgi:hypothetical protein